MVTPLYFNYHYYLNLATTPLFFADSKAGKTCCWFAGKPRC